MRLTLFDALGENERRVALGRARRRRFGRKEVVFHDGDPGDTLHVIVKGHFAVRVTTPLGDVATVRVLGAGDHLGELTVLSPAPRTGTVVALDAGETLSWHREEVERLRRDCPEFDAALSAALVTEVRRLAAALVEALYVPIEERVWRRLHELVGLYSDQTPNVVTVTQDDLAQLAGTTRQTVNRVLQGGIADRVVRVGRGRIEVLDLRALQRRSRLPATMHSSG